MKKTTFKRIAASIAALCICSMAVAPVVASAGTITIKGEDNASITVVGKKFAAYKIFDVSKSADGGSYNYTVVEAWRGTVINALNSIIEGIENDLATTANSEAIATALNKYKVIEAAADASDEEKAEIAAQNTANAASVQAFAQYLAKNIPSGLLADNETTTAATGETVELSVDDPGYYMVVDTTGDVTGSAVSAVMLNTASDDATVTLKVDAPTIEKKIWEPNANGTVSFTGQTGNGILYEANTANMYETVNYYVTSEVPDHTHYTKYFFVMEDTIDDGLDFNEGKYDATSNPKGVTVKIGDEDVTNLVAIQYQNTDDDNHKEKMIITFPDLKAYDEGDAIVVQYSADVNEDANVGANGNINGIKLNYSNDPTYSGNGLYDGDDDGTPDQWDDDDDNDGTPDDEDTEDNNDDDDDGTDNFEDEDFEEPEDDSTTDTPEQEVVTYLTEFVIKKIDESKNALEGAGFTLYSDAACQTPVRFETYTTDAGKTVYSVSENQSAIDKTEGSTDTRVEEIMVSAKNAGASITIYGLDKDATFYIKETTTPDGYNPIDGEITFTVGDATITGTATTLLDANYTFNGTATCTWSYGDVDADDNDVVGDGNVITVQNNKGSMFPTTGGIGTTIFTVVGVTLMAGAAGAFAIKRKAMNK